MLEPPVYRLINSAHKSCVLQLIIQWYVSPNVVLENTFDYSMYDHGYKYKYGNKQAGGLKQKSWWSDQLNGSEVQQLLLVFSGLVFNSGSVFTKLD